MQVVTHDESWRHWSIVVPCDRCGSEVRVSVDDLWVASFKVSGYEFAGTATFADKVYFFCPVCIATDVQHYVFVADGDISTLALDWLRANHHGDKAGDAQALEAARAARP